MSLFFMRVTDEKKLRREAAAAHCPKGMCGIALVQSDLFKVLSPFMTVLHYKPA